MANLKAFKIEKQYINTKFQRFNLTIHYCYNPKFKFKNTVKVWSNTNDNINIPNNILIKLKAMKI